MQPRRSAEVAGKVETSLLSGGVAGVGGNGGAATATAATTIISGSSEADAASTGGSGGSSGLAFVDAPFFANGGQGGVATASATASTRGGNATASASAAGGSGGSGDDEGGFGGNANASSTAEAGGLGDALSSAKANGGAGASSFDSLPTPGGNATATANASATGGGKAIATAVATPGLTENNFGESEIAQATSNAETVNGAEAQALSTAEGAPGSLEFFDLSSSSTAKTSFAGVTTTASVAILQDQTVTPTIEAIAQGGSVETVVNPNAISAISVALPDKAYVTTLIDGASNVADALLGPRDEIFGTADQLFGTAISTFDFRFHGDLLLGVIEGSDFDIAVNGAQIFTGGFVTDAVINLGSNFGPNIDLTIDGNGTFAIGGAVSGAAPEPSTWAMLLLGFAGLGLVGYRQTRGPEPQAA
jgi:hypothetical protein